MSQQIRDPATAKTDHAHRRALIAAQKELVRHLTAENKTALEDGSIPAIERIDAALTKAKADLRALILLDKQIEAEEAAQFGPTTNPTNAEPDSVVFVCDATGSMINKMDMEKKELDRAIQNLRLDQSFDVVFFQDEKLVKLDADMLDMDPENQQKAQDWIEKIPTGGTTDPIPALTFALKLKPELICFMTDAADFPDVAAVQDVFRKLNADHKTKVNTVLFIESQEEREANKESEPLMRQPARPADGSHRWERHRQRSSSSAPDRNAQQSLPAPPYKHLRRHRAFPHSEQADEGFWRHGRIQNHPGSDGAEIRPLAPSTTSAARKEPPGC
jgi:hypothetical protein